jgi:hypothetical protein
VLDASKEIGLPVENTDGTDSTSGLHAWFGYRRVCLAFYEKRRELESSASFPAGRKSDLCGLSRRHHQVNVLASRKAGVNLFLFIMLTLSYEFKLKPTSRQAQTMELWWEICRQVGNDGLRERQDGVQSPKSPVNACRLGGEYVIPANTPRHTSASQCQALTPAKKDHPQLKIPQHKSGSKCFGVAQHKHSNVWRLHGWTCIDGDLVFLVLRKKDDFAPLFFPK